MGKTSREKGKRGEREVAEILRSHGFPGRRTAQYCGKEGTSDVVGIDGYHIEVKRCEKVRIMDWLEQAEGDAQNGDVPVVMFRRNRGKWYAVLALEHFLNVVKGNLSDGTSN